MKKIVKLFMVSVLSVTVGTMIGACKKKHKPEATYTVNFVVNGVSVYSENVKKNGSVEKGYAVSDIEGYDFSGWFVDADCNETATFPVKVSSDLEFYGEWVEEPFTVTFMDGETKLGSEKKFKADYLVAPEEPTKDGFRFSAWYEDKECTKLFDFIEDQMPARDLTLYADWVKLYEVSFEVNGGNSIADAFYAEGEKVETPQTPTKEGYAFLGWFSDDSLLEKYEFGKNMKDENVVLYAGWRALNQNVTISFVSDDKVVFVCSGKKEGDPIPAYEGNSLSKDKFVFDGWFLDRACTQEIVLGEDLIEKDDMTLYAGWHLQEKYTVVQCVLANETQAFFVEKGSEFSSVINSMTVPSGTKVTGYFSESGDEIVAKTRIYGKTKVMVDCYTDGLVFEETSGGYSVTGCTSTVDSVYVSALYNGKAVVSIAKKAFEKKSLAFVSIGKNVSEIGEEAFKDCTKLATVDFTGNALKYVGYAAFSNTAFVSALQNEDKIVLNDRVLYSVKQANGTIELAESIIGIAGGAFENTGVEKVVATSVVSVGEKAFKNCGSLVSFKTSAKLETIEESAFEGCKKLSEVSLNGLTSIKAATFKGCEALETLAFSAAVKSIGESAFENCTALKKVVFGSSLQGSNLDSIAKNAFAGCTSLTIIAAYGSKPFTVSDNAIPESATLYVKTDKLEEYKTALPALSSRIDSVERMPKE